MSHCQDTPEIMCAFSPLVTELLAIVNTYIAIHRVQQQPAISCISYRLQQPSCISSTTSRSFRSSSTTSSRPASPTGSIGCHSVYRATSGLQWPLSAILSLPPEPYAHKSSIQPLCGALYHPMQWYCLMPYRLTWGHTEALVGICILWLQGLIGICWVFEYNDRESSRLRFYYLEDGG